ncbi:hypothetical protein GCM10023148_12200 [Actinokineospora soli]
MSGLRFQIVFHTPFRVSTGAAHAGIDAVIDRDDPLPATSLKGLMRATATALLGDAPIIAAVFGSPATPTPWRWSAATPDSDGWHTPKPAARVTIDPDTHTARPDMLGTAEQTGATSATFTVTPRHPLPTDTLDLHRLVLAVAGQATRSLGGNRRRGLGWVAITCPDIALDTAATRRFLDLRTP